mgnify:CR=1 FL=1
MSINVSANDPAMGFQFNSNGTGMFILLNDNSGNDDTIFQFRLSVAFDTSTSTLEGALLVLLDGGDQTTNTSGILFSNDSYVDLSKQGVFYDSINGADELSTKRYGNHNDYLVSEAIDCSDPSNSILPQCSNPDLYENSSQPSLFAGGQDGIQEFEGFDPNNVGSLCEDNPQDPLCFSQPTGGPPVDVFGPADNANLPPGTAPPSIGFWGDETKAEEFQNQTENFTDFAGNYCDENPDDPTCSQVLPPPATGGIIQDQDCDDNPYAPGCPQSGGQEGQGPPPEGEGVDCDDPTNSSLPQCSSPDLYNDPPPPSGGQTDEDCSNNPAAPGCQPSQVPPPPTDGEEYAPPAGAVSYTHLTLPTKRIV